MQWHVNNLLKFEFGSGHELFVTTNPLSQRTLRPDEFFVPTNYVFIGRKGSSGRTPRQFDYFALPGAGVTYYRLALDCTVSPISFLANRQCSFLDCHSLALENFSQSDRSVGLSCSCLLYCLNTMIIDVVPALPIFFQSGSAKSAKSAAAAVQMFISPLKKGHRGRI